MNRVLNLLPVLACLVASAGAGHAQSPESPWDFGLRLDVLTGSGRPTNDVISQGLYGHYKLNDRWTLGFSADHSPEFDVERVATLLDIVQAPDAPVIDAKGTMTALQVWLERPSRREGGKWGRFWGFGAGVNSVDIADQSGPTAGGGIFDVTIDGGTEFLVTGVAGLRRRLGKSTVFEMALRGEQHFADWKLTDRVSGATATESGYLLSGVHFGLLWRPAVH